MPLAPRVLSRLAIVTLAACGGAPAAAPDAASTPDATACASDATPGPGLVITREGAVHGATSGGTYAYLGIPYAAPPVADRRWQPPAPAACRATTLEATAWPAACVQKYTPQGSTTSTILGDEDCLYLNVWQPVAPRATPRPVMVWIHGGGNTQGSSAEEQLGAHLYDGRLLAERGDAIVVSLNYRLGPLGFLAHPALTAASGYGGSGNYGLMDQIAALTWVRDNIAAFGGDPAQVMVFGESAGGVDTCMLLASPLATGLFARAAIESGGCPITTLADGETAGVELATSVGCDGADPLACLRAVPATDLVADLPPVASGGTFDSAFGPDLDGHVLPRAPLDALADGAAVPVIIGTNRDETALITPPTTPTGWTAYVTSVLPEPYRSEALALYPPGATDATARAARVAFTSDGQFICPARTIARTLARGAQPVFRYEFGHAVGTRGVFHGLEIFFVWNTLELTTVPTTAADRAVAAAMLGAWARHAATGAPGDADLPWPRYDASEPYVAFEDTPAVRTALRTSYCDFWDRARAGLGF